MLCAQFGESNKSLQLWAAGDVLAVCMRGKYNTDSPAKFAFRHRQSAHTATVYVVFALDFCANNAETGETNKRQTGGYAFPHQVRLSTTEKSEIRLYN